MKLIQKSNFRVQGMFLSLFIFVIIMAVVVRSVCNGREDEDDGGCKGEDDENDDHGKDGIDKSEGD